MTDINKYLDELVGEALAKPAFTATGEDAKAYTPELLKDCYGHHVAAAIKHSVKDAIKLIPQSQPMDRMETLCRRNIEWLQRRTKAAITEAFAKYGEEKVMPFLEETKKWCDINSIALIHQTDHDGSGHATDSGFSQVMKSKKLVAPYFLDASATPKDCTVIYFKPVLKSAAVDEFTHFRVENLSADLLAKSNALICVEGKNFGDGESVLMGGNHLKAGWQLAMINNLLQDDLSKTLAEIESGSPDAVRRRVESYVECLSDFRVPRELSLAGHFLVENGEKQEIKAARAAPKPKPTKRDTTPDADNPELRNKPRKRGKTDE